MSVVDELAGALDGVLNVEPRRDIETYYLRVAAQIQEALAARGIDLELPYQWQRVEKVNQRDHRLRRYGTWRMQVRGPWAIDGVTWQAIAEPHNATGVGDDHEIEVLGSTPAAALMALADALEARE